ncbi:hypothetical protein [uncultured Thiodictyon sp.]|uniref:hypothetical protein n=1 Tax=uncultured Thiodictyon sp. TaxID=1846217 RepID=UPI0025D16621|nr:hypothetical protein [uncultured Thiodictyon sp.]
MNKVAKPLKKLLQLHMGRAWEAELRAALGALADRFDQWRSGVLTTEDLDSAVHEYHNGIAREIWKRYTGDDPALPLARAVALGLIARESLPPEVLERIAPWLETLTRDTGEDD